MDSSNSGSFQSSSGGAGDNDESISSFFNPATSFNPNLSQILHPPPPPPPPHHHNFHQSTTNTAFYNHPYPSSGSGSAWTGNIQLQPDRNFSQPDIGNYNPITKTSGRGSDHQQQHQHQIGVTMKNPKKRTRASRRAPTTVLTTDTTNFRQMVQEFTGIPTAPFATSPFSRRLQLDLFNRVGGDGGGGGGVTSVQPFRPSVQKIQQQPPPFLNSTANIVESGTSNNTTSGNYRFNPSTINNLQKQPSSFLDLQNPMFSFQSLLQNSVPVQQSNQLSGLQRISEFQNSLKRSWSGENEKVESFEGVVGNNVNIGGSKFSGSGIDNVMVSSISGGDQVQGNEGSWSCPSN